MSTLKPDSVIACLDDPDHVQAVLDASMWSAKALHASIGLLHATPNTHRMTAVDYSGCLHGGEGEHLLSQFADEDGMSNGRLREQGRALLKQSDAYCAERQAKCGRYEHDIYALHRHSSVAESLDYVDDVAQLIVIGHEVTGKSTLSGLIRPTTCPILVTHTKFVPPKSALFAFDNKPTCQALLEWLCKTNLMRGMSVHIVMVGKDTTANKDALREAYARLKQAGMDTQKSLVDCNDVTSALLYYQKQHDIEMLMTGAFCDSRLKEWMRGSDTQKLLDGNQMPYLLYPKS